MKSMKKFLARVVSAVRRGALPRSKLAYVGYAMFALALTSFALASPARAADPTDAAGLISATAGVFAVVAILLIIPTARAVVGTAVALIRGAKGAAR